MVLVIVEGFQECVWVQWVVVEQESKGIVIYCIVCSKKFVFFNVYENYFKFWWYVELEKKVVQVVSWKVEVMNEKNLEKGLSVDSVDKDVVNVVIQQVIKVQLFMFFKKIFLVFKEEFRSFVVVVDGGCGIFD